MYQQASMSSTEGLLEIFLIWYLSVLFKSVVLSTVSSWPQAQPAHKHTKSFMVFICDILSLRTSFNIKIVF